MKLYKSLPVLVALLAFAASCSTSTQPSDPSNGGTTNNVNFTSGAKYTYTEHRLDTANGPSVDPRWDTITSTVVSTNASFAGKTNVVVLENVHSDGHKDTTYYSRQNDSLYRYNFALESINSNALVKAYVGNIDIHWVLQAVLSASPGTTWSAGSASLMVLGFPTTMNDQATMMGDTTLTVGATQLTVKHVQHTVSLAGGVATDNVDTYVSLQDGTVLNVIHSTKASVMQNTIQSPGMSTQLVAKQ